MNPAESIAEKLKKSPEDWDIRILAIEEAVRAGDLSKAKQLVREDPSDDPTPPDIKVRLHRLLTQGVSEGASIDDLNERDKNNSTSVDSRQGRVIEVVPPEPERLTRERGGGAALAETEWEKINSPAPSVERGSMKSKWDDYDGELVLVDSEWIPPAQRCSSSTDRLSAVALALLAHVIVLFLVSLVAIHLPRQEPPQLVVSVTHEREAELITPRITKPDIEITPAAASTQAVDIISSLSSSSFDIPEVDRQTNMFDPSLMAGIQPLGNGDSFSTKFTEESSINFFGISGKGKTIVFIIDATPQMLVDEKGGMDAYDKVKDEVGIMLANLNRGTQFNILLYQGKRLVSFREELVPGLPSNLRLAIEWLDPLNRTYDELGLRDRYGTSLSVTDREELAIQAVDVAHYTKAIQKAMEWNASSIFCIASGYERIQRTPTPKMLEEMKKNPPKPGTPGTVNPAAQKAWNNAVAKTREWLRKENDARRNKGMKPKVVVNFNRLVQQRTGVSPPRRTGGTPASGMPNLPPVTPDDIEDHIKDLVKLEYKEEGFDDPSLNMVIFLGEGETIDQQERHFRRLTSRNHGKLKLLRGLAALQNVTSS
ncbi:MAG: hypothetical protein CMO55_27910 [Verrucomicrobiales bacterium]|nr:hypothetical protein [Verrucomicrobiales bacterium]